MGLFKSIFTWWDGPTFGTRLFTLRKGEEVGSDDQGNRYFRGAKRGRREQRWVIYNGENEASRVPAEWHGWLHGSTDAVPSERAFPRKAWEQDHVENTTGTGVAWKRPGVITSAKPRARATGDYEAWQPE